MLDPLHPGLLFAKQVIYDPCGFNLTQVKNEAESEEYAACTFSLNTTSVKFRSAKITPTKTGQFVTLWKRNAAGITEPHPVSDPFELYVISTRTDNLFGQFIFTRSVLEKQKILSGLNSAGKRGFRVYPPWDITQNKQAQKTQAWQLDFFLQVSNEKSLDKKLARRLYLQDV